MLNQFSAIKHGTTQAQTKWEKSLLDEDERVKLDDEYKWTPDTSLMTNQMGVVRTALENFTKSKGKLKNTHIIGV